MILFIISLVVSFYSLKQLWVSHSIISTTEILLLLCNIGSSLLLVFAVGYNIRLSRKLNLSTADDEDDFFHSLERKYYRIPVAGLTSLVVAFLATVIGFIFLRDSHPKIILVSMVIVFISVVLLMSNSKVTPIIFPNYKPSTQNMKKTLLETLDIYDDGQKYILLKSLYKLYFLIILLLVLLIFALMLYSIFSGNNQTVSIIGIGFILLLILTTITSSLRPKKLPKNT